MGKKQKPEIEIRHGGVVIDNIRPEVDDTKPACRCLHEGICCNCKRPLGIYPRKMIVDEYGEPHVVHRDEKHLPILNVMVNAKSKQG